MGVWRSQNTRRSKAQGATPPGPFANVSTFTNPFCIQRHASRYFVPARSAD